MLNAELVLWEIRVNYLANIFLHIFKKRYFEIHKAFVNPSIVRSEGRQFSAYHYIPLIRPVKYYGK